MSNNKLKIVLLCAFACCVLLLSAACQPTPQSEAVVNKGSGELENKVLEESDSTTREETAPATDRIVWNETKTVNVEDYGEYTVTVSMDIKTPALPEQVPAYLIEPQELSIDFMKKAAQYLMKGEIFDSKESKEDVTKELLDYKRDISAHTITENGQREIESYLEFMEKRYNDAADSNKEAKFEYNDEEYGERGLHLKSYANDNSIMEFSAYSQWRKGMIDGFFFRTNEFNRAFQYLDHISGEDTQANGTKTTYKEALATADEAMATLFDEPYVMAHSNIIDIINYQEYLWNEGKETSQGQAYVFYYVRQYDGFPSLFIDSAPQTMSDNSEYAKPYAREYACVVVDDRGIAEMWYESYSNTLEKLNENVELMPFDQVLERFKDGVFYHNLWGFPGSSTEINITGVEFGMVREPVKDNADQFMMVPAWNFIGNMGNTDFDDSYGEGNEKSILALSAIDGSIITDYAGIVYPK